MKDAKDVRTEKVALRLTVAQLEFIEKMRELTGHNTVQKVIYDLINASMVIKDVKK